MMQNRTPTNIFANYVMRGRQEAIFAAVLTAILPFFSWVSVVVVALVTLRRGLKDGFSVMLWAMLPVIIFGAYQGGLRWTIQTLTYSYLLSVFLAWVWRVTLRFEWVVHAVILVSVCFVLLLSFLFPESLTDGVVMMETWLQQSLEGVSVAEIRGYLQRLVVFLPGIIALVIVLSSLLNVVIARAMQANLYHPGGLTKELKAYRASLSYFIASLAAFALSFVWPLAHSFYVVFSLPLALSGLSIMHWFAKHFDKRKILLLSISYVLILSFMPYSFLPLLVLGSVDIFINFRKFSPEAGVL